MKNLLNQSILTVVAPSLLVMSLTGCKQNPFPEDGVIKQSQTEQGPIDAAIGVEMEGSLDCKEGEKCEIKIVPRVGRGKTPLIEFVNLPAGATYDEVTDVLSYTPSFDVVDLNRSPKTTAVNLSASFFVMAKEELGNRRSYPLPILVQNVNRDVDVTPDTTTVTVSESQTAIQKIMVTSLDLPQGPFSAMLSGHPDGMVISSEEVDTFSIRYTPGRTVVTSRDSMDYTLKKRIRNFNFTVSFSLPNGQVVEKDLSWKVVDDRLAPSVSAPSQLEQGPVVSFTVRAEDLNGENQPILKADPVAAFGRMKLTELESNPGTASTLPNTLYSVQWDQLTTADIGKSQSFDFNFCTHVDGKFCTTKTVNVKVTGNEHLKPVMDRSQWPVSTLQSLRMGEKISLPLTIVDGEDSRLIPTVKILPKSMEAFVKLQAGKIEVSPPSEGIHQFSIEVTSLYEQKISEGFLFEVLPASWESTVILTGYGPSKEASALRQLINEGEILSSAYQLNDSSMRLRSTMIVTTEALMIPDSVQLIEKYRSKVKTFIVSSPSIANSSKLKAEFSALGVHLKNRIADDLSRYTVAVNPRSNLESPSIPAGLLGTLTTQSSQPQVLDVIRTSSCEAVLYLQKPATQLTVGAVCNSANQRTVILGFEVSDLNLSSQDQEIGKKWISSWIKGAL
jgi:hypothetical protein